MKRLFTSVFTFFAAVCLTACSLSVPGGLSGSNTTRENRLGEPFSAQVSISLERFQGSGSIVRYGEGDWDIEFDSPNTLSGVMLSFDLATEGTVTASYKGLSFSVPKSAIPVKAMLLDLIEAVDTAASKEQLSGEEKDGMLAVNGALDGGDYTLTVDSSGLISSFEMPGSSLEMTFTDVVVSAQSTTAADTATETPAVTEQ
ncbi:MAG: hypothetical protein IJ874_02930 [Ruminococcus sp.]|nr:hypothetical protein [Ruminococcus sp.]